MPLNIWHKAQPNKWLIKADITHIVGYLCVYRPPLLTNYYQLEK